MIFSQILNIDDESIYLRKSCHPKIEQTLSET